MNIETLPQAIAYEPRALTAYDGRGRSGSVQSNPTSEFVDLEVDREVLEHEADISDSPTSVLRKKFVF